jgi:microcin C transport system permease protein
MTAYFIRRFLLIIPTFLGVTIIVFAITRIVPGGPLERKLMEMRRAQTQGAGSAVVEGSDGIPESAIRELKKQYHLDKPGYIAYFLWLKDLAMLNLGESYYYKKPILNMVVERFPVSLAFGLTGFFLSYLVCVPLGIFKAIKHGSAFDFVSSAIVFIGYSIPGWALGILLLLFLASGRFYDIAPLGGVHSTTYDSLPAAAKWIDGREWVEDEDGIFHWDALSWSSKVIDRIYYMFLPVACYMVSGFATLTILM